MPCSRQSLGSSVVVPLTPFFLRATRAGTQCLGRQMIGALHSWDENLAKAPLGKGFAVAADGGSYPTGQHGGNAWFLLSGFWRGHHRALGGRLSGCWNQRSS